MIKHAQAVQYLQSDMSCLSSDSRDSCNCNCFSFPLNLISPCLVFREGPLNPSHSCLILNGTVAGFPEFWYSWRHLMQAFKEDYDVVAINNRYVWVYQRKHVLHRWYQQPIQVVIATSDLGFLLLHGCRGYDMADKPPVSPTAFSCCHDCMLVA